MRKESKRAKMKSLRRSNNRIHSVNSRQIPRGGVRL